MNRFIGFVTKEFYHIFRDKRSMFILFGMPIAQIMLFGFAITNEINNVNIAILDQSKDSETQKIISKISASPYFKIEQQLTTENQIEAVFKKGSVKAVLVFEKDFSKNLQTKNHSKVQVISDATDPNMANTITNYVHAILQKYIVELNKNNQPINQIQIQTHLYYNPELKSVFTFVPGVMTVILMLVSAMMTSLVGVLLSIIGLLIYSNMKGGDSYVQALSETFLFGGNPTVNTYCISLLFEGIASTIIVTLLLMLYWNDRHVAD